MQGPGKGVRNSSMAGRPSVQRCIQDVSKNYIHFWVSILFFLGAVFRAANTEAAAFRQPPPGPGWAAVVGHGRTWQFSWCFSAEVGHFTSFHPLGRLIGSYSFVDVYLYLMYPPGVKHSNGKLPIVVDYIPLTTLILEACHGLSISMFDCRRGGYLNSYTYHSMPALWQRTNHCSLTCPCSGGVLALAMVQEMQNGKSWYHFVSLDGLMWV